MKKDKAPGGKKADAFCNFCDKQLTPKGGKLYDYADLRTAFYAGFDEGRKRAQKKLKKKLDSRLPVS